MSPGKPASYPVPRHPLDTKPDGSDAYVLGEINLSCVGFTTHLEPGIQQKIAAEIIRRVSRAGVPSPG